MVDCCSIWRHVPPSKCTKGQRSPSNSPQKTRYPDGNPSVSPIAKKFAFFNVLGRPLCHSERTDVLTNNNSGWLKTKHNYTKRLGVQCVNYQKIARNLSLLLANLSCPDECSSHHITITANTFTSQFRHSFVGMFKAQSISCQTLNPYTLCLEKILLGHST